MFVIVAERAQRDRDEILAYYQAPSAGGDKFLLDLEDAVVHLSRFPETAVKRRDLTRLDVRFWLISPYFIVVRLEADLLIVLTIVHAARNIRRELRESIGKRPTAS